MFPQHKMQVTHSTAKKYNFSHFFYLTSVCIPIYLKAPLRPVRSLVDFFLNPLHSDVKWKFFFFFSKFGNLSFYSHIWIQRENAVSTNKPSLGSVVIRAGVIWFFLVDMSVTFYHSIDNVST